MTSTAFLLGALAGATFVTFVNVLFDRRERALEVGTFIRYECNTCGKRIRVALDRNGNWMPGSEAGMASIRAHELLCNGRSE